MSEITGTLTTDGASIAGAPKTAATDVASAAVNAAGHLIITMSDGRVIDAGSSVGPRGIGISGMMINADGDLIITYGDGLVVNAGHIMGAAEAAETAAGQAQAAEAEAETQAQIAANNVLNGVSTHNVNPAAHEDIRDAVLRAEAIARGRALSITFDTKDQLDAWVVGTYNRADGITVADMQTGYNLYIRDTGVPDYWWDGAAPSELEAEAPDLVEYYTKSQVDAMMPIYLSESDYAALVAAGTVVAGRVYYPVPDDQWEG